MLKLLICEIKKIKRKKLFQVAFLTTFVMPLFFCMIIKDKSLDNMMSAVREENGFLVLISLSVVIAANLFFEEHDYDTLKNLMCVPVTRSQLVIAKLLILLVFDVAYELVGYGFSIILCIISGISLEGWVRELGLTFGTGILLWAAVLPCVLLVVWFNKSYIISVIIAFAYTVLNFVLHISDTFVMVPVGLNFATFLPVPMIFRWLYQFHSMVGAGEETIAFVERFRPYFVSLPVVSIVLLTEALISIALMIKIYQGQNA